jgi:hypothetical protein
MEGMHKTYMEGVYICMEGMHKISTEGIYICMEGMHKIYMEGIYICAEEVYICTESVYISTESVYISAEVVWIFYGNAAHLYRNALLLRKTTSGTQNECDFLRNKRVPNGPPYMFHLTCDQTFRGGMKNLIQMLIKPCAFIPNIGIFL